MGNAAAVQSSTDTPGQHGASGAGGDDAVFSSIPESQQESKTTASTRGAKASGSTSVEGVPDTGFSDSDDEEEEGTAAAKPSTSPTVAKRQEAERSSAQVSSAKTHVGIAAGSPAQRTLVVGGAVGSLTYEKAFEDEISRDIAVERSALEKSTLRPQGPLQRSSDGDASLEGGEGGKKHKKKKKKKHSKQDRERRAREEKGDEDDDFDFDENDIDPELARKQMVELANEAALPARTDSAISAEAMRRADAALRQKQLEQQQRQNKGDVDEPIEIDGVIYNRPSGGAASTGATDTWSANDDASEVWRAESGHDPEMWQADANAEVWRPDDSNGGGDAGPDVWRPDDTESGADVWRPDDGNAAEPDRLVLN
eukprot:INCI2953.1.p2 GENE.INCI2953.1~~INCI2953.1.p2  ORF type:complete len:369 (-),score=101.25 INCI2953.1:1577-2683(-)